MVVVVVISCGMGKVLKPWRKKLSSPSAQFKVPPIGLDLQCVLITGSTDNPFTILLYPQCT